MDQETRYGRAARLAEIVALGEPQDGRMLAGESHRALYEAQMSYVQGNFLCAILATHACIEKLLAGYLDLWGKEPGRISYTALLEQARVDGLLLQSEYDLFQRLRRARNPHAHYRPLTDPESNFMRSHLNGWGFEGCFERDAWDAIRALVGLVNRRPFAIGPPGCPFDEEELLPPVHPDQLELLPNLSIQRGDARDAVGAVAPA